MKNSSVNTLLFIIIGGGRSPAPPLGYGTDPGHFMNGGGYYIRWTYTWNTNFVSW